MGPTGTAGSDGGSSGSYVSSHAPRAVAGRANDWVSGPRVGQRICVIAERGESEPSVGFCDQNTKADGEEARQSTDFSTILVCTPHLTRTLAASLTIGWSGA